jgi:uncharacterized phage protein (TIGR01671 family)
MNREIKFRYWDGDEMIKWDDFFFSDMSAVTDYSGDFSYIEQDKLKQFTGRTDKNGTEIYEGDILSDRWKVEVYKNDEGTFMVKFHVNPEINRPISLKKYLLGRENAGTLERDCEIIGNIFENPELIK